MADSSINFTKGSIDALPLPAQGQRATYHDTKTPGLQLRVTSTGNKTFVVRRRVSGGEAERVTLGTYPAMTPEQAREKAAEVNATIAKGASPRGGFAGWLRAAVFPGVAARAGHRQPVDRGQSVSLNPDRRGQAPVCPVKPA